LYCIVNKKAQLMLAYPRDAKTIKKSWEIKIPDDDDDDFSFTSLCHITDD